MTYKIIEIKLHQMHSMGGIESMMDKLPGMSNMNTLKGGYFSRDPVQFNGVLGYSF